MMDWTDIKAAPLILRVDAVASDVPPAFAVRHLCRLADRVGIMVECSVNGMRVLVSPGTNEDAMANQFVEAQRRKVDLVSSDAIPPPP